MIRQLFFFFNVFSPIKDTVFSRIITHVYPKFPGNIVDLQSKTHQSQSFDTNISTKLNPYSNYVKQSQVKIWLKRYCGLIIELVINVCVFSQRAAELQSRRVAGLHSGRVVAELWSRRTAGWLSC